MRLKKEMHLFTVLLSSSSLKSGVRLASISVINSDCCIHVVSAVYAQVNKKKKKDGTKETDDEDTVIYTDVVGTKAARESV